ncbi:phospholipid transport system substrate-binding protein [Gammaproteobacteria bacterium]
MIKTWWILISVLGFLWMTPLAARDSDPTISTVQRAVEDPQQLVKNITDSVLSKLHTQQEEMRRDPHLIYAFVEELVLPHFDFERMSRWVLGRYWNDATAAQRIRFVEEFRNLLVRTYGVALLDYTDEKIQFLPSRGDPAQGEVTVRISIKHHGNTVSVDSNLYLSEGKWKVYDVDINGVSLVANYRNSFAAEIRKSGMDGLITRLTERNQGQDGKRG